MLYCILFEVLGGNLLKIAYCETLPGTTTSSAGSTISSSSSSTSVGVSSSTPVGSNSASAPTSLTSPLSNSQQSSSLVQNVAASQEAVTQNRGLISSLRGVPRAIGASSGLHKLAAFTNLPEINATLHVGAIKNPGLVFLFTTSAILNLTKPGRQFIQAGSFKVNYILFSKLPRVFFAAVTENEIIECCPSSGLHTYLSAEKFIAGPFHFRSVLKS